MKTTMKFLIVVCIFSIAMAALEAAVVVYLRTLYYPTEFTVAFKIIDERVLFIELIREIATIVMLMSIGYLVGKSWNERLAYFLFSFAVWDIFYYVWLKAFINWPSSFFDWDILFLVPITWIGPVGAPIICSITMMVFGLQLLRLNLSSPISKRMWSFLMAGSLLILFTFIKDYADLIISNGFLSEYLHLLQNSDFIAMASAYTPKPYA